MASYLIGDLQGCDAALQNLLDKIDFSSSRDTLFVLGDLVNRGPQSDAVLRRFMAYDGAARCLLGNHDLHLLAVANGIRKAGRHDTLDCILQAADRSAMLEWLRQQDLALLEHFNGHPILMVHAGVLPTWTAPQTLALAHEVQTTLRAPHHVQLLAQMYGNLPDAWDDALEGVDRLRVIINGLTRLRFCTPQGVMDFKETGNANQAPDGYQPWFDVAGRQTAHMTVAFGHWSTLGWLDRTDVLALDSGCVWGGCLSALRITAGRRSGEWNQELVQVQCAQAQKPGQ